MKAVRATVSVNQKAKLEVCKFVYATRLAVMVMSFVLLCTISASAEASVFRYMGVTATESCIDSYIDTAIANADASALGFQSTSTPDDRSFTFSFVAGDNSMKMKAFSDDGVDLTVEDLTTGSSQNALSNLGNGPRPARTLRHPGDLGRLAPGPHS